jgi:hypothetical protein
MRGDITLNIWMCSLAQVPTRGERDTSKDERDDVPHCDGQARSTMTEWHLVFFSVGSRLGFQVLLSRPIYWSLADVEDKPKRVSEQDMWQGRLP